MDIREYKMLSEEEKREKVNEGIVYRVVEGRVEERNGERMVLKDRRVEGEVEGEVERCVVIMGLMEEGWSLGRACKEMGVGIGWFTRLVDSDGVMTERLREAYERQGLAIDGRWEEYLQEMQGMSKNVVSEMGRMIEKKRLQNKMFVDRREERKETRLELDASVLEQVKKMKRVRSDSGLKEIE